MPDDLREVIERRLSELVSDGSVASVGYAVVTGDEVTAAGGFGDADEHTVFQVGSVTKGFTGLLLADLADREELRLDDLALRYLPGAFQPAVAQSAVAAGTLSLLDLATHTAGLPRLPPGMFRHVLLHRRDPYVAYPEKRLLRAARRSLAGPGGQTYAYSNYGFGVLGHLLASAGGSGYQELIGARVCDPLGLTSTSFRAEDHVIQGYARGRRVPVWHLGALAAAGGLYSTAADLAKLLVACLNPAGSALSGAIRIALEPRKPIGGGEIGLAWHHAVGSSRVIWHNGMTGGYSAMVAFNPAHRTGVAALANIGGVPVSPLDRPIMAALANP